MFRTQQKYCHKIIHILSLNIFMCRNYFIVVDE